MIQTEIRIALSKYGMVHRNNVGNFYTEYGQRVQCGVKGESDLFFFGKDGTVAFIEVKDARGRPSKEQIQFLAVMQSYGFKAGICRSVEDAIKLIGEEDNTMGLTYEEMRKYYAESEQREQQYIVEIQKLQLKIKQLEKERK